MTKYIDNEYGQVCISTGEVIDLRESLHISSSSTTSHGNYNSTTTHSTHSTTTLKIAIKEVDGTEQHLSLGESLQIGMRNGNKVSVGWFVPKGKKNGPYVFAYNHDTRELKSKKVPAAGQAVGCLLAVIIVLGLMSLFAGPFAIVGLLFLGGAAYWGYQIKTKSDAMTASVMEEFEKIRASG